MLREWGCGIAGDCRSMRLEFQSDDSFILFSLVGFHATSMHVCWRIVGESERDRPASEWACRFL